MIWDEMRKYLVHCPMAPHILNQNVGPVYLPHSGTMWPPRRITPTSCDFNGKSCGKSIAITELSDNSEMQLIGSEGTMRHSGRISSDGTEHHTLYPIHKKQWTLQQWRQHNDGRRPLNRYMFRSLDFEYWLIPERDWVDSTVRMKDCSSATQRKTRCREEVVDLKVVSLPVLCWKTQ